MSLEVTRRGIGTALMLILAAALVYGVYASQEGHPPFQQSDDRWSGVFLTNGQAYFGHFYPGIGDYARLTEVYYVLATQLQPQDPSIPTQTQLSLQRLGGEIHGPTQEMRISKRQILFIEDLRPDSAVVQSIRALRSGTVPVPQQPQATTAAPTQLATPAATPTPRLSPSPSPSPSPTR